MAYLKRYQLTIVHHISAVKWLTMQGGWTSNITSLLHWTLKVMALQRILLNLCVSECILPSLKAKTQRRNSIHTFFSTDQCYTSLLANHLQNFFIADGSRVNYHNSTHRQRLKRQLRYENITAGTSSSRRPMQNKRQGSKLKMINEGDKVLRKQNKSTTRPPFHPKPFHVVKVKGSQLTMKHENQTRIRNKGHIKLVKECPLHLTQAGNRKLQFPSQITRTLTMLTGQR